MHILFFNYKLSPETVGKFLAAIISFSKFDKK